MKPHPDNPRYLDPHAKAKLKRIIQRRGYCGGIVYNQRTSRIVGGHQRIMVIDELEGSQDYGLEVDVIDVDEKKEAELLIALNNPAAQGLWDVEKLEELIPSVDLSIVGFDQLDLESLFPDRTDFAELFEDKAEAPDVLEDAAEIERIKAEKKRFKEQGKAQDDARFMLSLVFGTAEERRCFAEFAGCPSEESGRDDVLVNFVDGRNVVNGVGGSWDELWADWCKRNKGGEK